MNIFDIMGPVMVGPSSSHTTGAVRMGFVGRKLLGFQPARADIALHGSFAATGTGHGTDRAIVAGLLAMKPDDPDIPRSFKLAEENGLSVNVRTVDLRDAHPNTAVMTLIGERGRTLVVSISALEDGGIRVDSIDGMESSFSADTPTLIIRVRNRPGLLAEVSSYLTQQDIGIDGMQLYRDLREDLSVMVFECDQPIPPELIDDIQMLPGAVRCIYIDLEEG